MWKGSWMTRNEPFRYSSVLYRYWKTRIPPLLTAGTNLGVSGQRVRRPGTDGRQRNKDRGAGEGGRSGGRPGARPRAHRLAWVRRPQPPDGDGTAAQCHTRPEGRNGRGQVSFQVSTHFVSHHRFRNWTCLVFADVFGVFIAVESISKIANLYECLKLNVITSIFHDFKN